MIGEALATFNETGNKEAADHWPRVGWYEEGQLAPEIRLTDSLDWMYDKWNTSHDAIYHAGNSSATAESAMALTMPQGRPESERIFWYGGPDLINPVLEAGQKGEDLQQNPLKGIPRQIPIGSYRKPITITDTDGAKVFIVHRSSGNAAVEVSKLLEELREFASGAKDQGIHEGQPGKQLIERPWYGFTASNPESLRTAGLIERHRRREQSSVSRIVLDTATPAVEFRGGIGLISGGMAIPPADYYARIFSLPDPAVTDTPRFHPIVEAFSRGFGDTIPGEETLKAAALIVEAASGRAANADIEVDETDGSIAIQLRSKDGFLVVGEYSVYGELQANIYNDKDPNPDAGIQDLWIKHLPNVSPEDLIKWF